MNKNDSGQYISLGAVLLVVLIVILILILL